MKKKDLHRKEAVAYLSLALAHIEALHERASKALEKEESKKKPDDDTLQVLGEQVNLLEGCKNDTHCSMQYLQGLGI